MLNTRRAQMLFTIGLHPKLMVFWILYHSVDIVHEDPWCIQELMCKLYPKIAKRVPCTPNAVECALRRMCRNLQAGKHESLWDYLPTRAENRPKPSELLSAWLLMAETQETDNGDPAVAFNAEA